MFFLIPNRRYSDGFKAAHYTWCMHEGYTPNNHYCNLSAVGSDHISRGFSKGTLPP